ncbi:MAG: ecotin [Epsilonproteobacteria bacterium 4484_65]|nr:MAG: ecotin [Epsilonproteobacteria bacterium 4484_65]
MAVALAGSSLYAEPAKKDNIHMFPQAEEGFVRHVIEVPKTDNDYEHKVELLIGKVMLVDCNKHSLMGKVESVTLKGWGYKYLEVTDIQSGPSTLMACKEPKTEKFISIRDTLRRYNSRFPIVAYVPEGYEVRYRIWSADDNIQQATQR